MRPTLIDAYKLLHEGLLALSQVEANGMRVDLDYVKTSIEKVEKDIFESTQKLKETEIYKVWKRRFGSNTNLNSCDQLGKVLFEEMKYECPAKTNTGKFKTDIATLEKLGDPFVQEFLKIRKLKKVSTTYLKNILDETDSEGFLHPVFSLHTTQTYRSSSSNPNFQNLPIRDKVQGQIIRSCFIPRPGHCICECDYSGIEVHSATFYHKDPVMMEYLCDKTKDMHRDMAQACYKLPLQEVTNPINKEDEKRIKAIRYCGKNKFVFPQFYGDWYLNCAVALWQCIDQFDLKLRDGTPLKKWLAKKGITELGEPNPELKPVPGTFIYHIKKVEEEFWGERFKVYKKWKQDWYEAYLRRGCFTTLTGFEIDGLLRKNEVINYPIQGTAFHCLLWSLIQIQKYLNKHKMKTLIVGQIHDSIVADVYEPELKDYLALVKQVMTVDIKKHWKFINTPIEIEAEVSPLGKSWFEKQKVNLI